MPGTLTVIIVATHALPWTSTIPICFVSKKSYEMCGSMLVGGQGFAGKPHGHITRRHNSPSSPIEPLYNLMWTMSPASIHGLQG